MEPENPTVTTWWRTVGTRGSDIYEKVLLGLFSFVVSLIIWIAVIFFLSAVVPQTARFVVRLVGGIFKGSTFEDTSLITAILTALFGFPIVAFPLRAFFYYKLAPLTWLKRLATCAIGLLFLCLPLVLHFGDTPLVSDAELVRMFQRSRSDLEKLRQMVNEDDLKGIPDRIGVGYGPKDMPAERLAEYRRLLSSVSYERLWANGREQPFEIVVDGTGFLSVGDYKGYYYSPKKEEPIVSSLDHSCFKPPNAKSSDPRFCNALRPLGDGWWLIRYEYK